MEIPRLCDCVADKLIAKYKSAAESDKDDEGGRQIGSECVTQVLSK